VINAGAVGRVAFKAPSQSRSVAFASLCQLDDSQCYGGNPQPRFGGAFSLPIANRR
jgi:hypothetical protein